MPVPIHKQIISRFNRIFGSTTTEQPPKITPMKEMGSSGTSIHGGFISTKDKSPKWTGKEKYRTASELVTNISIVAAGVHYFLKLIAHPKWTVRPSDDNDEEAKELAKFVENVMDDMVTPWPRIIARSGMYRFYGFGIQEWTAKKRPDGRTGFVDIEPRPQHTIEQWSINPDTGSVTGMWQRAPQTGKLHGLPRGKVIYIVEDTITDSPEGLGIFRHMLEPYIRIKQYYELEIKGFERDLRGTPVGRVPYTLIRQAVKDGELTEVEGNALSEGLEKFVKLQVKESNTGITLDSMPYESEASDGRKIASVPQWGVELLTGSGAGLMELSMAIDRTQRELARLMGVEMLMMGDKTGNRALSTDKSRNLYLIANAVLSQIASSFQKDFIDPLWMLNGFPDDKKPKFAVEDVAFKNIAEITQALRDLAQAGAPLSVNDPVINDIRDALGVSRQDMDLIMSILQDMEDNENQEDEDTDDDDQNEDEENQEE